MTAALLSEESFLIEILNKEMKSAMLVIRRWIVLPSVSHLDRWLTLGWL